MNVKISVICPVYNEEKFLPQLFTFLENAEPHEKEIIFIDGKSSDSSYAMLTQFAEKNPSVQVLSNPKKFVAPALNIGIKRSLGKILVRIDAHSSYSPDYFLKILDAFEETGADIVGGCYRISEKSGVAKILGGIVSSGYGSGKNLLYNQNFSGYTDHVTFGAWKKELFSEIGYFDENLIRNQDDEFHYRAVKAGKKIYQSSEIKLWYHPRNSLRKFFSQYFQYGYYKPYALKKNIELVKLRHLIPSSFVMLIISEFFYPTNLSFYLLILYFALSFTYSIKIMQKIRHLPLYVLGFFLMHTAYGTGFIAGIPYGLLKNPSKEALPANNKNE